MKIHILLLACLLVLSACGGKQQGNRQPILTVSIEPLRYFAEAIAGDKFEVVSMVPEGSNPETYDPTPQQLVALNQSQAYLRIGYIGFEQAWMEKLQQNTPGLSFFDVSEGIDLIRETGGGHSHAAGVEPHVWSSVQNAYIIADNICRVLCQIDGKNTEYYRQRLAGLAARLGQTDREVRAYLLNTECTFLIYHPALSYFARDYGLTQISIEQGGKEPSPAHLQALIRLCRKEKVRTIFVQKEFDTRNAEAIAQETGAEIVRINPLSYKWDEEMIHIAKVLNQPAPAVQ